MFTYKPVNWIDSYQSYNVSELGAVYKNGEKLEVYSSSNGYDFVFIESKSNSHLYPIDELVAMAYCERHKYDNAVMHIDGNLQNNAANNLRWFHEEETWEDITIPDLIPGRYSVSNFGSIRSSTRGMSKINVVNSRGYKTVSLRTIHNKTTSITLHKLVALYFVKNPLHATEINHIDGNKINNHYKNLEWVSHTENMQHARKTNAVNNARGENTALAVLPNSTVHEICKLFLKYNGTSESVFREISKTNPDVTLKMVQHIKHKSAWRHISDMYWSSEELDYLFHQKIHLICEYLVRNKGDVHKTLSDLKDAIPDLSKRYIEIIKYKETYSEISDLYFKRGEFSKQLSTDEVYLIESVLYKNAFDIDSSYAELSPILPKLTIRSLHRIRNNLMNRL